MIIGIEVQRTTKERYFLDVKDADEAKRKLKNAFKSNQDNTEEDLDYSFGYENFCGPAGSDPGQDVSFELYQTELPNLIEATNSYWSDLKMEKIN